MRRRLNVAEKERLEAATRSNTEVGYNFSHEILHHCKSVNHMACSIGKKNPSSTVQRISFDDLMM